MVGVFAGRAARYQLFGRVDQKVLQTFRCAEAHPFLAGTYPSIIGFFKSFVSRFMQQSLSGTRTLNGSPRWTSLLEVSAHASRAEHSGAYYVILKVACSLNFPGKRNLELCITCRKESTLEGL